MVVSLIVILSEPLLRSEGSGRAVRCVAFFATPESHVWLASYSNSPTTESALELRQVSVLVLVALGGVFHKLEKLAQTLTLGAG